MQDDLFPSGDEDGGGDGGDSGQGAAAPSGLDKALAPPAPARRRPPLAAVQPAPRDDALHGLATRLPAGLRLGTSSWTYPGWTGLVWADEASESLLSKHGLPAYAQHPLLRTVSLDRAFYRPLTAGQYARYAAQVPGDFRFVVKAPSLVTDALVRGEDGRGMQLNPAFLDGLLAAREFVQPALDGLGPKLGVLVFQLSPLPPQWLARLPEVWRRIGDMLSALPALRPAAPDAVIAVEVRDPQFITPEFATLLRAAGATYCLGLHSKLPPIEDQLPMLRQLWPGPLVCRWNLHRRHGPFGYEQAQTRYAPFDRIHHDDAATREALASVIEGTTRKGQRAYVTVSNTAEGSAPLSIRALAESLDRLKASRDAAAPRGPDVPDALPDAPELPGQPAP